MLGIGAAVAGAGLALASWLLLQYMPLVALGLSSVIFGIVSFSLGRALPPLPAEFGTLLSKWDEENLMALIEEFGLQSKAVYLPTATTNGSPRALVPLRANLDGIRVTRVLPRRLIVQFGPEAEDIGVLVATPGLAAQPFPVDLAAGNAAELEVVLSSILVHALDLAESVRVQRSPRQVIVELSAFSLAPRHHRAESVLGSPMASLVASVAAEMLDAPVRVVSEAEEAERLRIELRVMSFS